MAAVSAAWLVVALPGMSGCSEDEQPSGCAQKVVTSEQSCSISADCESAGLDLSCVDGVCRLTCRADADCDIVANAGPNDDPECRADPNTTPAAFCEAGLCEVGCPDVPCEGREACFEGRCVLYGEGFEVPPDATGVDLRLLGFNEPPGELANTRNQILWSGLPDCSIGFNCSGPAAQGERFLVLESEPTSPKGSPVTGTTCRACACCLECLADPPDTPVNLNNCPASPNVPSPLVCQQSAANCNDVCSACDACPVADRPDVADNPLLVSCEETAASRRCALCDSCDSFLVACQAQQCPDCAANPAAEACRSCLETNCLSAQVCQDCVTCADAQRCARNPANDCNQLRDACDAQGADGCFDVPVDYLRAQLFDAEQAVTSPPIDLSGVDGAVVLQLDYVSFDVGVSYFPGIQGVSPELWPRADQNVRVQLCSGTCGPNDWRDAELVRGGTALLPPASERNNGRTLGDQTLVDWRRGRIEVDVPTDLRGSAFRYRLLPQLDRFTQLAVDNILIRRRP